MTNTVQIRGNVPGNLGRIHRSQGVLNELLNKIPEWHAAAAAMNRLAEAQPAGTVPSATAVLNAVAEQLITYALAGEEPPEDLATLALDTKSRLEAEGITASAHRRARDLLIPHLDNAVRDDVDHLYGWLNDALEELLDQAHAIANPNDLLDPARVLAAGRADDHATWTALCSRYDELRQAQSKLATWVSGSQGTQDEALLMRNVERVFPHWAAWRERGYLIAAHDRRVQLPLSPPWPADRNTPPGTVRLVSDGARPEFLAWALEAGARLWIPTEKQHAEEQARLAELRRNPDDVPELVGPEDTTFVSGSPGTREPRRTGITASRAGAGYVEPYDLESPDPVLTGTGRDAV